MLFERPQLSEKELDVCHEIEGLRRRLRSQLAEPRRWFGSLRRLSFARAIQGSNSIEGLNAALDDVAAAAEGEEPLDADLETKLALVGYRDAMTYVLQLAPEERFEYSEQLLKSLHFMMTNHDLKYRPGLWRAGTIYVHNEETDEITYEGPDIDFVPGLIEELVDHLNKPDTTDAMVRAAMAHLNLVMIHPFRDGNGRMARCLQTLVIARDGVLSPQFCSVEEYLGRNIGAYYDVLAEVGGGSWQPERDSLPWIRFMLTAHYHQAHTLLRRIKESEQLWTGLERLAKNHGLPERVLPAMYDAALGWRVRNATYRRMSGHDMSEQTASRDLRLLVEKTLFEPHGERRGRYYTGTQELRGVFAAIRQKRPPRSVDPFA
ncbi:MAG: Fic family protein [Actinomycetota bacterium]